LARVRKIRTASKLEVEAIEAAEEQLAKGDRQLSRSISTVKSFFNPFIFLSGFFFLVTVLMLNSSAMVQAEAASPVAHEQALITAHVSAVTDEPDIRIDPLSLIFEEEISAAESEAAAFSALARGTVETTEEEIIQMSP